MPDLDRLARSFAAEANELLNSTITDGARLKALHRTTTSDSVIAPGISRSDFAPAFLALRIGRRPATGYLLVGFTTQLDEESRHLTVSESQFGLCLEPDRRTMLLHYDYIRDPRNQYPPAHVQVHGTSPTLSSWRQKSGRAPKTLERLHLPVGGRRFRPSLEDVVELLIVEELARPRAGWEKVIEEHRRLWNRRQLQAAVRQDPATAAETLSAVGHPVGLAAGSARPERKRR